MKTGKRPAALHEKKIDGYDVFAEIDYFVFRSLVDILKFQEFKIDPTRAKLNGLFFGYNTFGYRIRSRRLASETKGNTVEWLTVYHEGLHNFIGLRFGTKLPGRPMMTLLNECLGIGLAIYLMSKLALETDIDCLEMQYMQKFAVAAKELGVSLKKEFRRVLKDPFKAYKETVLEAYSLHSKVFDTLRSPRPDAEKWTRDFARELKNSKNFIFIRAELTVPVIFIAANCGLKSSAHDKRAVNQCLEVLNASRSMDEFFVRLGVKKILRDLARPTPTPRSRSAA